MSSWRVLENSLIWRTATAVCVGRLAASPNNRRRSSMTTSDLTPLDVSNADASRCPSLLSNCKNLRAVLQSLSVLAVTPNVTRLDSQSTPLSFDGASTPSSVRISSSATGSKRYDFVIVGNGTTGRSALETLRAKCPSASIALIDPLRKPKQRRKRVDFIHDTAVSLDPRQRRIGISNDSAHVDYKYGVLIATGAHGAPPPSYLMDEKAQSLVYELRPTILTDNATRPCLPPTDVRTRLLEAGKKGQILGILGSSWDALDLAIAAAAVTTSRSSHHRPHLLFGASGPLSQTVPNYLSTAIAKRLRQKRIQIHDRTLIRYINHEEDTGGAQIYSARSFDFLDSTRTHVDKVVVAPDIVGPRGNAVRPTLRVPDHLWESRDGRFWYESWSQLSMPSSRDPSMIICYKDDGRIAVNSELAVCTGVYAAGSVAKCGNALTGHADVAGEGIHDAMRAGKVAALNMARHYQQDSLFSFAEGPLPAVLRDSIPVFRSDILSYDDGKRRPTSLSSIGIRALCVGTCDSERYATHGVWWTNQAAQQRIVRLLERDEAAYGDGNDVTPKQSKRRRQRLKESTKMVYGVGVVYYLDRTGRIQGVMTWGLPFSESTQHERNPHLLQHIKQVIVSNGGMNSVESELDQMRMSKYLAEQSRAIVALAFSESTQEAHSSHHLEGSAADFPRPLHRYTDNKPMGVRSHAVLKRKDGHGQGILGEDLFSRYEEVVPDPSPPKPLAGGVGYASENAQGQGSYQAAWNWYDFQVFEQRERRWAENESNARPVKEDALWIRKGDENRNVSAAETRAAVMDSIVGVTRRR